MLTPEEAFALDLQGYVVVKQAFATGFVERLRERLLQLEARALDDPPADCPISWTPAVNELRLLNVLAADPQFADVIDHEAILQRVRGTVPGQPRLTEAYSITRGAGIGLHLHRIETAEYRNVHGQPRCEHLTATVALSDCGPEDGPFVVIAGSHKSEVPFPYTTIHPGWRHPGCDHQVVAAAQHGQADAIDIPWESIPGYTEVCVEAGDLVLFVQSLWHGAKELRSDRTRRTLYFSYGPYHVCNWHGIEWSDALKQRVTAPQRALLEGPFIGTRYASVATPPLPEAPEFGVLPDSDRGARPIEQRRDDGGAPNALDELTHRFGQLANQPMAERHPPHMCRIELDGGARAWTLQASPDEPLYAIPQVDAEVAAVIGTSSQDLADVLAGKADPSDLFHNGRIRVDGDLGVAMRIASQLMASGG